MSDRRDMVIEALASREATLLDRVAGLRTECATRRLIALVAIRAEIDWQAWHRCELAEQAEIRSLRQVLTAWSEARHG